jgi:hypothetical protein
MHIPCPPIVDCKIRVALVGCGRLADNHSKAINIHAARCELTDVCDVYLEALAAAGAGMAIHWPEPLHHQPADAIDHPAGVTASETVLSLPMSADLSAGDQQRRIDAIVASLRAFRPLA